VKLLAPLVIAFLLFGGTTLARADFSKEDTPPANPAAGTLDNAKQKIDAGDFQGAIRILTVLTQKDPGNADAFNLMGYSLRKTGQTQLALEYYNRALGLMPKHLGANEYLGELYVELGQMDKAKERLAVLAAACGNCQQEQDLAAFIQKGPGAKARSW
jgi:Flp pilus assembly protein TadD